MASLSEEGLRRASKELVAFLTGSDTEYRDEYTMAVAKSTLTSVPFVGIIAGTIIYDSMPMPSLSWIDSMGRGLQGVGAKSETSQMKGWVNLGEAAGLISGVPGTRQATELLKKLAE